LERKRTQKLEEEKKKAELKEEERSRTQTVTEAGGAQTPSGGKEDVGGASSVPQAQGQLQTEHVQKENRVEISVNEDLASALSEVDYFLSGATSPAFSPPTRVESAAAAGDDAATSSSVPQKEASAVSEEEVLFQADPASAPPSPGKKT